MSATGYSILAAVLSVLAMVVLLGTWIFVSVTYASGMGLGFCWMYAIGKCLERAAS